MVYIANVGKGLKGPMFFNVDKAVGAGCPDTGGYDVDVGLVQYFLGILGFYKTTVIPVGFTSRNDPDTVGAIKAFQASESGLTQDGRVSVAQGLSFGPGTPYTIVRLNAQVKAKMINTWPRVHLNPAKPPPPLVYSRIESLLGLRYDQY